MNRHPPRPLDAEERALAAMLPRPHGRAEPGPELDARILASAQAAIQPKATTRRPRRSWIAPTAVAASLMLAVGLAWQLRPPPALEMPQSADATASAPDAVVARAIEAPIASREAEDASAAVPMTAPSAEAKPAPASTPPIEVAAAKRTAAPVASTDIAEAVAAPVAAPPPAAPAPPAPPPPPMVAAQDAVAFPQAMEPARAPAPTMSKSMRTSEAASQRAAATAGAARAQQDEAERAANAAMLDTIEVGDDPGEEVPPATADSPAVREAWLRRIGELLEQGQTEDAKASLAEFKRRYPEASLPPELRKLEP